MRSLIGPHATPRRSLAIARQKTTTNIGWISYATYETLPPRFQRAAKTLQERGELIIEEIL